MKSRILTVIILAAMAVLAAVSAQAAPLQTRVRLVIEDKSTPSPSTAGKVSEDLINEDGIYEGTLSSDREYTDESGSSATAVHTEFTNRSGDLMLSVDVVITASSDEFTLTAGKTFTQRLSVDVTLELYDEDYNEYAYSLDVYGLPEWLNVNGELISSDALSTGTTKHHHEFTLAGTPTESKDLTGILFSAAVTVSGDYPAMRAWGHKEVNITVESADTEPNTPTPTPTPTPDPDPDPSNGTGSNDITPTESQDVTPTESQDVTPESQDITPESQDVTPESPDVTPPESQDITPESPDVTPPESPDITPPESPDVPVPESPDIEPNTPSDEPSPDIGPNTPSDDPSPDVEPTPPSDDPSPNVGPNPPNDDPGDSNLDIGGDDSDNSEPQSIADVIENMTDEEKASVTTLKVGSNITDLSGLDQFTNLKAIDLSEADIETVDLSSNPNIEEVSVTGNKSIKSLNLSGSGVVNVDASGCDNLSEVDVSGCESLETLDVSNTPITTLNAQNCENLAELNCANCRLEDLNISGCESLNILDCSNNRLHKLDAYMLHRLDDLRCRNQNITGWRLGRTFSFREQFRRSIFAADDGGADLGIENVTNLRAWDSSGNEISAEYDAETGEAVFNGEPAKIMYDYITGFNSVKMDVTVFASEPDAVDNTRGPGSSGGCDTGAVMSIFAAMLVLAMLERKR